MELEIITNGRGIPLYAETLSLGRNLTRLRASKTLRLKTIFIKDGSKKHSKTFVEPSGFTVSDSMYQCVF
jgi:hypothetical protein